MSTILQSQPSAIGTMDAVEGLVHKILNNLQVIEMEASLQVALSNREAQCVIDATLNIERFAGKLRECLLLPR